MIEESSQDLEAESSFTTCMTLENLKRTLASRSCKEGTRKSGSLGGCCKGPERGAEEVAMCDGMLAVQA